MKHELIPWSWLCLAGALILLGVVNLAGCADQYWVKDKEPAPYVKVIYHANENEVERSYRVDTGKTLRFGEHLYGYAKRVGSFCFAHAIVGDSCGLRHELKHCEGWDHDDRQAFIKDCGP